MFVVKEETDILDNWPQRLADMENPLCADSRALTSAEAEAGSCPRGLTHFASCPQPLHLLKAQEMIRLKTPAHLAVLPTLEDLAQVVEVPAPLARFTGVI